MRLKPLREQVVVVTGASSGIGREASRLLAREGATVVGLARSEEQLRSLVAEIAESGGAAHHVVCDVTDFEQMQAAADLVEERFGRIDTWVNNAGVMLYGEFQRTTPAEFHRVMEVDYMGTVHGALVALPALRRAGGGALISVSSVEGFLTLPMHSAYAAAKHAIDGVMDGLRRELIADGAPVSVTVVRPAVMDTPLYDAARNHMGFEPQAPPPFYDPVVAAACIAYAAAHPVRDLYAGGIGPLMSMLQWVAPSAVDTALGRFGMPLLHTRRPAPETEGNLDAPRDDGRTRGGLPRPGRRISLYTWLELHPRVRLVIAASALLAAGALTRRGLRRR